MNELSFLLLNGIKNNVTNREQTFKYITVYLSYASCVKSETDDFAHILLIAAWLPIKSAQNRSYVVTFCVLTMT